MQMHEKITVWNFTFFFFNQITLILSVRLLENGKKQKQPHKQIKCLSILLAGVVVKRSLEALQKSAVHCIQRKQK